jgi:hypothetical protein
MMMMGFYRAKGRRKKKKQKRKTEHQPTNDFSEKKSKLTKRDRTDA